MLLIIHMDKNFNYVTSIDSLNGRDILEKVIKYTQKQDFDYSADSVFFNDGNVEFNVWYTIKFYANEDEQIASYTFAVTRLMTIDDNFDWS